MYREIQLRAWSKHFYCKRVLLKISFFFSFFGLYLIKAKCSQTAVFAAVCQMLGNIYPCTNRSTLLALPTRNVLSRRRRKQYLFAVFQFVSLFNRGGRDSSVGITTLYGLDSPGIESRWGQDFFHLSKPALGSTQPPMYRVSFPGVYQPGSGVDHPPHSSAEVKESVELHLCSPSGSS